MQAIIVAVVLIVSVPPLLDPSTCESNFIITYVIELHYSLHIIIRMLSHMTDFKFQLISLLSNEIMPCQSCKNRFVDMDLFHKSSHICRWTMYHILLIIRGEKFHVFHGLLCNSKSFFGKFSQIQSHNIM